MLVKTKYGIYVRKSNELPDMNVVKEVIANDTYQLNTRLFNQVKAAKFVIDIGAHIGCFSYLLHLINPHARIICVEVCPENINILQTNVGEYAEVIHAACTYEKEDVWLLNSVFSENSDATGGSILLTKNNIPNNDPRYWKDWRKITKITLDEIINNEIVDILKLDCEGSEFNILENVDLSKIKCIVGEYHGRDRWINLINNKFQNWKYIELSSNNIGAFNLCNTSL